MPTPTNAFGQQIKVGDVVALTTTSHSRANSRLAKIIKIEPYTQSKWDRKSQSYCDVTYYKTLVKIFIKSKKWVYNSVLGTGHFTDPVILSYNRRVQRLHQSFPVDISQIPQDFMEAINEQK